MDPSEIESDYDNLEKKMLDSYYSFIGHHGGYKFLHWNMRDINYGFFAIDHRYKVLGGIPEEIGEDRKCDLSRIFIAIFGVAYIGHPRLENLLKKNSITTINFLSGKEEAKAFENNEYVRLHQSTLKKTDLIANLAERAHDRQLKTNTTWWEMHGGRIRLVSQWVVANPFLAFSLTILGIGLGIFGIYLTLYPHNVGNPVR